MVQLMELNGKRVMIAGCSDEEALEIVCAFYNVISPEIETRTIPTTDIADTFFSERELPELFSIGEDEPEKPNFRNEVRNFLKSKRRF